MGQVGYQDISYAYRKLGSQVVRLDPYGLAYADDSFALEESRFRAFDDGLHEDIRK